MPGATVKKKKARVCACGNFQEKKPMALLYTAHTDVDSIRIVSVEVAQRRDWGVRCMDVATAFSDAPVPTNAAEREYS